MSLVTAARRRLAVSAAIGFVLAAGATYFAWSQAARAGQPSPAREISGIRVGHADAVDSGTGTCTQSSFLEDMADTSRTFRLKGKSRPVIVLFQAEFAAGTQGAAVRVRLLIDGVEQAPGSDLVVHTYLAGTATNGFNFITTKLESGEHTATIQWSTVPGTTACVDDRSLIVMH